MLGPHLTPDNLVEVLALARHRTKKEPARLIRSLDPLPEVPSRIEPLGPAPSRLFSPAPTWSQSVGALNPIRELEPGARPRDWMDWAHSAPSANDGTALAWLDADATPAEHARSRLEPQRYKVQFEASEEPRGSASRPGPQARPRTNSSAEVNPSWSPNSSTHGRAGAAGTFRRRRRAVFERDAGRCTYSRDSGERCRETARLELHHSIAFPQGGEHRLDNVTLRCRAHNALAAEEDFGRDVVTRARDSSQHELWAKHEVP